MQTSILGITPIFMSDTLERNGPITRETPSPIPCSNKQQDHRQRPDSRVKRPKQKSNRWKDRPIRVIDGHVFVQQPECPYHNRCYHIRYQQGNDWLRRGCKVQNWYAIDRKIDHDTYYCSKEINGSYECNARPFGVRATHKSFIY